MPEISDAELKELQDAKKSKEALEAKNKELLEEKRKLKEEKEAADKLAKEKEQEALKANGDYKTLAEQLAADKAEREKKDKETAEREERGAKLNAIQTEMVKLGINGERITSALRLVDLAEVKYDPTTRTVVGADLSALKLKTSMPEIFVKKNPEDMGHGDGGGTPPAELSDEDFAKLPADERKKHRDAHLAKKGITMKKPQ